MDRSNRHRFLVRGEWMGGSLGGIAQVAQGPGVAQYRFVLLMDSIHVVTKYRHISKTLARGKLLHFDIAYAAAYDA